MDELSTLLQQAQLGDYATFFEGDGYQFATDMPTMADELAQLAVEANIKPGHKKRWSQFISLCEQAQHVGGGGGISERPTPRSLRPRVLSLSDAVDEIAAQLKLQSDLPGPVDIAQKARQLLHLGDPPADMLTNTIPAETLLSPSLLSPQHHGAPIAEADEAPTSMQ